MNTQQTGNWYFNTETVTPRGQYQNDNRLKSSPTSHPMCGAQSMLKAIHGL
jgi:hypothetical protein